MTRFDITSRELHDLIEPVLPHASTDTDLPEINVVRIEAVSGIVCAVATDRYTLAAARHVLPPGGRCDDFVFHVDRVDAATILKLFDYSKDYDPELQVTIDPVAVPVDTPAGKRDIKSTGMKITRLDGKVLSLRDNRNPMHPKAMDGWRRTLSGVMFREMEPAAPVLLLNAGFMARWAKAARKGERLTFLAGADAADPILVLVEERFAGIWKPAGHIDAGSETLLTESPWRHELPQLPREDEPGVDLRTASGLADGDENAA